VNVTVAGAGIIGCAVAYELASRGARVRVIDPRGPGQGATGASAGVLAPYIEGHSDALLRLGVCSLDQYDRFIARVAADACRPVEFRRTGTLEVACSDAEARDLAQAAGRLSRAGAAHSLLDGDAARRLEPALSSAVLAGLLVPQQGYVAATAFTSALVAAAERHGVTFVVGSVEHVAPTTDPVVIAAGSWSSRIVPAPAPVRPIRGQLLHLALDGPPLTRVAWGRRAYLVPWEDGSVLAGATSEDVGFDERATDEGISQLLERAAGLVPAVAGARLREVRVGLRPATADQLPIIGASSTMRGVYYATGHYRNGVLLAPLTALMVGDLVLDGCERAELALTRPGRFGL
jgi:glycine oxidase